MILYDLLDSYDLLDPYSEDPCKECGRIRLLQYKNLETGVIELVCEKCNYNNTLDKYMSDDLDF